VALTPTFIRAVGWIPERDANARALRRSTGGQVVWDVTHDGAETFRTALAMASGIGAIHLEDDIRLTSAWRPKIESVIAEHGDSVIQFFSLRGADTSVGSRWMAGRDFCWAQCFYVPGRLSAGLVAHYDHWLTVPSRRHQLFDLVVGDYLRSIKERYWLSVPNLVEHQPWLSAVNPRRPLHRHSLTFEP
jgi:hypothetical protein